MTPASADVKRTAPKTVANLTTETRVSPLSPYGPARSTVMDWSADVAIHGKLASVGSRLIEGTAKKLIGQTFDCIRSKLEG